MGVVVLNTLIDACCRCGDLMNAGKLLDDMVRGRGDYVWGIRWKKGTETGVAVAGQAEVFNENLPVSC